MAYIQNGIGYTLKCDKCGTLSHRRGKDKPFLSLDINELDSIAKEYGWLINKRVHKCTYCRTFKNLFHLASGKTIEAVGTINI